MSSFRLLVTEGYGSLFKCLYETLRFYLVWLVFVIVYFLGFLFVTPEYELSDALKRVGCCVTLLLSRFMQPTRVINTQCSVALFNFSALPGANSTTLEG